MTAWLHFFALLLYFRKGLYSEIIKTHTDCKYIEIVADQDGSDSSRLYPNEGYKHERYALI